MSGRQTSLIALEERIPAPVRVVFAAIGAGVAFLVLKDLGRSLWPINLGTPITATIIAGALFVAGVFLSGGLLGGTKRWTPEPHALRIDLEAGRFHQRARLTRETVVRLWAEESSDADTKPRAFVCIDDLNGKTWRSPSFLTLSAAQDYAQRLAQHLRVQVTPTA